LILRSIVLSFSARRAGLPGVLSLLLPGTSCAASPLALRHHATALMLLLAEFALRLLIGLLWAAILLALLNCNVTLLVRHVLLLVIEKIGDEACPP
jgi:hypothetical protein